MVEIIAHRGASREARENTMEAFDAALEAGATGIELDVHATLDGKVVVHHDPVVTRSDGLNVPVATTPWRQLSGASMEGGYAVPLLSEVLEMVGNRATVYVEIKASGIEEAVRHVLDGHEAVATAVHSFDHRIPQKFRTLRPETPIGVLSTSYPLDLQGFIGPASPEYFWQHTSMIDESLVNEATRLGCRVFAWTENNPVRARELVAMGVAGICTDLPRAMLHALRD